MFNCAAIQEMTHATEKHQYFPLRVVFTRQHDPCSNMIHPECQVTWSLSLVSLPRVPVARETNEVRGSPGGREGYRQCTKRRCWALAFIYISSSCSIVFINDVLKSSRASSSVRTGLHADCCRACLCARLPVCLRCAGSREGINLALQPQTGGSGPLSCTVLLNRVLLSASA